MLFAALGLVVESGMSGEFARQAGRVKAFYVKGTTCAKTWKPKQTSGPGLAKQFEMLEKEVRVHGLGFR